MILTRGKSGLVLLVVASLCCCNFASAQPLDSSTFAHQYTGAEMFDGTSTILPWSLNGGIEDDDLALNGTALQITPLSGGSDTEDNNGWIEQDGGDTPWEAPGGVVEQAQWALEVSVGLNDLDLERNDNIALWAEGGGNRQILLVTGSSVTTFGGTVLDTNNNTDGPHAFQLQFNANDTTADPTGTYQLYRDGVLIGADLPRESGQSLSRLIIGDCCTSLGNPVDQYEVSYVRFGAVPEPSSLTVLCLGLLGFFRRRQRG